MLNSLFGGGGNNVYITVSPSCGLEMIVMDSHNNIKAYAQSDLAYNEAQREIADYNEFKTALESLFKARNVNPAKAKIHLSLPTVWYGTKEGLPLLLDDNAITNIVLGELEQTYIFKRKEPMPFWFDALVSTNSDSRNVFYTAVQKEAIDQIKEILAGMGATLVSVECSLFADLKALAYTGIAAEQMQDGVSWSLMIINNSGFQLIGMQGKRILEYYEEPLPIKSYEGEEIYSAIENAAQIALMSTPSSSLVVLSETDLVSAEIMASRLQFGGTTLFVEDNQFKKEPLAELSLNILSDDQIKVSLHMIGSIVPAGLIPVDVNFIVEGGGKKVVEEAVIKIGSFELTPTKASIIMVVLAALILGPVGLVYFAFNNQLTQASQKSMEMDGQIAQLDAEIKAYETKGGDTGFDPVAEIEKVLKNNRVKIMAYAALGESIPKDLYLTYFMTGDNGMINIKGCADSVEDVYVFFKNLKDSLVESKLRLSKLDLKSGSLDKVITSTASTVDDAPYIFEITNMDKEQLQSFMDRLTGKNAEKKDENSPDSQQENNSEQQASGN